ncbi:energy-coupling factor ABC transporter permease [bacterium]|nr:energy-coupling factor ABC transporter permease [bacterium]
MHVGDAQLTGSVLAVGALGALVGVARSLLRIDERSIPRVALVSSAFFAISLWHLPLPIPGTSIHLVLLGLLGLMLGRDTFLAVGVVLFFQAFLLGHGGVTTIGVNTLAMSLPGPILARLCRPLICSNLSRCIGLGGFLLGFGSVLFACLLISAAYLASQRAFLGYLPAYFLANLPLMLVEGWLTASATLFLSRVRPETIGRSLSMTPLEES